VLWRIDHGQLDGISPERVLLHVGLHNLAAGDGVSDTAAGIEAVCLRIHEKLPRTKLLVLGILPCEEPAHLAGDVDRVNFLLQTRLHPQAWARVLDLGNKFRNADGSFNAAFFADGLHLNHEGYTILADNLKPILDKSLLPLLSDQATKM